MAISAEDFDFISQLVRNEAAIVLEKGKEYLVESRLEPLARAAGLTGLPDLVASLRKVGAGALQKRVVDAMTTNETSFFRDVAPFDALKKHLVPELVTKNAAEKTIQIWSAAASTGQEAYSISMLLKEYPFPSNWKVDVMATDLNTDVLDRARSGQYSQLEVNRGLPVQYLVKYFEKRENYYEIKPELRSMVTFRELNLVRPWPLLPKMDVIFLRNVLIYFDLEVKRGILNQVKRVLKPTGYLILGAAETTLNLDEAFLRVRLGTEGFSAYKVK